jgi:LIVCS family branched-chain amino acid:cation transporter
VYVGFSYVAAFNSEVLSGVASDELISAIAIHVLGPYAGVIVCVAVALACLTTAIALSSVFAEFIYEDLSAGKCGYVTSLIITLVITAFMANLDFAGIVNLLAPILQAIYPSLIVLSLTNIFYKLYSFTPVKTPFGVTLVLTVICLIFFDAL